MKDNSEIPAQDSSRTSNGGRRFWVFVVFLGLFLGGVFAMSKFVTIDNLVASEERIKQFYQEQTLLTLVICFVIYTTVTGLSIPGALLMSVLFAWLLGFWPAFGVISLASTTGATLSFLLARFLFRDWYLERFSERLTSFNQELDREGPFYLFSLRLTPAVPFFVINAVMGLTKMKTWTFWWVSWLGMMPWTAIFVNAGSRLPKLKKLQEEGLSAVINKEDLFPITVALVLIGLFPIAARKFVNWYRTQPEK